MRDCPAASQPCQWNFNGGYRDKGCLVPDYKGERDGLRGVSGCVRSPRDLRSEEVSDTFSHRRRDGNISRRPTVKLTGAGHDNQHCAGGTRRPGKRRVRPP
ncbi:protein of unknown function [Candidatus Methylomirabilis oxygeniifera]|uniref:Uncharacterized protein n=1 Tax=Methylomirabilis oxygeniifera TaxID=671143 RepID=D5MKQ7_METO1|nr:protein of unknown function [Candidatus Methylomirabilis oxyfera]